MGPALQEGVGTGSQHLMGEVINGAGEGETQ